MNAKQYNWPNKYFDNALIIPRKTVILSNHRQKARLVEYVMKMMASVEEAFAK